MKILLRLMLVFMLMFIVAPAYAGEAMQMWRCEMDDETSEEEVIAMAQAFLKAAKTMPGGEGLKAYVNFPVAVNAIGQADVLFVVVAPSFAEWGKFWDSYSGSDIAAENEKRTHGKIVCPAKRCHIDSSSLHFCSWSRRHRLRRFSTHTPPGWEASCPCTKNSTRQYLTPPTPLHRSS